MVRQVQQIQRRAGSYAAGFTRPFQTIDRIVGFLRDTDINKDKRQKAIVNDNGDVELVKRGGLEVMSLEATRYIDNILDIFRDTNAESDFSQLRVSYYGDVQRWCILHTWGAYEC